MKIVLEQSEMKAMVEEMVKTRYSELIESNQAIVDIKNVGHSYSDVEIIIEDRTDNDNDDKGNAA